MLASNDVTSKLISCFRIGAGQYSREVLFNFFKSNPICAN